MPRGPATRGRRISGAAWNDTNAPGEPEALGRSRGGLTTKIVLAADRRARPLSRVITAGQRHDSTAFTQVLAGLRIRRRGSGRARTTPRHLLADKAFSNQAIRRYLRRRRITATIPQPADQITHRRNRGSRGGRPPALNAERYRQRNSVERAINKLKQFRAVATRYDKRGYMYQAAIDVASIHIWLNDPVQDLQDTP